MQITLDLPEELAAQLIPEGMGPSRAAREAFAVEGHRTQRLSASEVRRMLGFETRMEVHTLLAEHDVNLHYTAKHLEQETPASHKLYAFRTSHPAQAE